MSLASVIKAFPRTPNEVRKQGILLQGTYPVIIIRTRDSAADGTMECGSIRITVAGQRPGSSRYKNNKITWLIRNTGGGTSLVSTAE